jgi:hypothetical protein
MRIRHYLAWACVVACGALGARALVDRPEPPRVVTVMPPPTVIAISVPIPPAPPPPAPLPPVHVGCGDVATIGLPTAKAPRDVNGGSFVDVSVSREGCVIAARTKDALSISWDGGATFSRADATGVVQMVAAADRVALLLDDGTLGTLVPGQPMVRHAPKKLAYGQLLASENWTALVADALVAVTDDGGVTWRYVEPTKDVAIGRLDGSRLIGYASRPTSEPDGEHLVEYITTVYTNDLAHPAWRKGTHFTGTPADNEDRYARTGDAFWGCGSSEKLLDVATGAEVAGGLRDEVWPVAVRSTHGVTFASLSNELMRLDGGARKIDDMPDGALVGVDAAGTPIINASQQLLRWSKTGGWRVLADATP